MMKLVRRTFQFLTGRWMRRLVWLPLTLFAVLCTGASMQAVGLRLSLFRNKPNVDQAALPVIRYLDAPSSQPIHYATIGQPAGTPVFQPNSPQANYPSQGYGNPQAYGTSTNPTPEPNIIPAQANLQFSNRNAPNANSSYHATGINAGPVPSGFGVGIHPQSIPAVGSFPANFGLPNPVANSNSNSDTNASQLTILAQTIRSMQASDVDSIRDRLNELLSLAIQHFDAKQSREREQLKAAKESLATWEEAIAQRDSLKKPLIESHIAQLLHSPDLLNWSFSGADLLKVNSKEANYIEIIRDLWPTGTLREPVPQEKSDQVRDPADLPPTLDALPMPEPIGLPVPVSSY